MAYDVTPLAPLATATGLSLEQLQLAVLDALEGRGFERLKEFGLRFKPSGLGYRLQYHASTQWVGLKPSSIYKALLSLVPQPGQRVLLQPGHPHAGHTGTLVSYGPYGLSVLGLIGWYVQLDGNWGACYAQNNQVQKI